MNRIVRERYPVAQLPEDLREGLGAEATVIVQDAPSPPVPRAADRPLEKAAASWSELLRRGREVRQVNFNSADEVDEYVRSLRE